MPLPFKPKSPDDMPRDDQLLDLGRALVDLGDAGVAVVALDREVLEVSRAAVDLHGLARAEVRGARREQLRGRRLAGVRAALVLQPRRAEDAELGGVEARRHVGDLELDGLEGRDRAAELLALLRVLHRRVARRA